MIPVTTRKPALPVDVGARGQAGLSRTGRVRRGPGSAQILPPRRASSYSVAKIAITGVRTPVEKGKSAPFPSGPNR